MHKSQRVFLTQSKSVRNTNRVLLVTFFLLNYSRMRSLDEATQTLRMSSTTHLIRIWLLVKDASRSGCPTPHDTSQPSDDIKNKFISCGGHQVMPGSTPIALKRSTVRPLGSLCKYKMGNWHNSNTKCVKKLLGNWRPAWIIRLIPKIIDELFDNL